MTRLVPSMEQMMPAMARSPTTRGRTLGTIMDRQRQAWLSTTAGAQCMVAAVTRRAQVNKVSVRGFQGGGAGGFYG